MHRRRLLAALAAGVSLPGCTALSDDPAPATADDPSTDAPPESPTATPRDDGRDPEAVAEELLADPTVVEFETAPLTAALFGNRLRIEERITAAIDFTAPATPESPATIGCVVQNRMSYEQTFSPRRLPFFDDPTTGRTDGHDTVYLAPTENNELAERVPGRSRDADGRWRVDGVGDDWYPSQVTLGPEEALLGEFHLLGYHQSDEPPVRPGTYRFSWREASFHVAVWPTESPGPTERSRFAGADVPDLPRDGPTAWFHEADAETEVYLAPSTEAVDAPARIDFELVNRAHERLGGNPYYWALRKLVDGEWYRVAPWAYPAPLSRVSPGATDESSLHVFTGEPVPCEGAREVGFLGGGRYAYTVGFSRGDETHAAVFDLDAPSLEVPPENGLDVTREAGDGERIVVESPRYEEARTPARFTVTRADSAADRLLPEQLPRHPNRAFRNTLPLFEPGVEAVELLTDRGTALRSVEYEDGESRRVVYEGEAFEAVGETE